MRLGVGLTLLAPIGFVTTYSHAVKGVPDLNRDTHQLCNEKHNPDT